MESVSIILVLVGIGCIAMGIVLLTQDNKEDLSELCKDHVKDTIKSREKNTVTSFDPIEKPNDRIWLQETREQSHQLRPYPAYI